MTSEEKILRRRRRYFWLIVIILFLTIDNDIEPEGISSITVEEFDGFEQASSSSTRYFYDGEQPGYVMEVLKDFEEEIEGADSTDPQYHMKIDYYDGSTEEYYLWKDEFGEVTSLMNLNDPYAIYKIPEELTDELTDYMNI